MDKLELEPYVIECNKINAHDMVYYDNGSNIYPAIVLPCPNPLRHKFLVYDEVLEVCHFLPENVNYGKTWKCWSTGLIPLQYDE